MPVSIRDVATHAGVSLATVSKVLNNRTGARIALGTQQRVREAASKLGYQPNRFARGMGGKHTHTLGLMISGLQNPFFLGALEEAEKCAMAAGYQVMLDAAPSVDGTYQSHGKLRGWPVDGVLIWAGPSQTLPDFLGEQARDLPVVYMGYPRQDETSWIAFDLYQGGRQAMEHLIAQGYRRIGYVYPWDWPRDEVSPNHQAYLDACRAAGIVAETISTVRAEETRRVGLETGLALAALPKDRRPEAVFCHNDVIAVGLYHGLRRAGLRVPEDMAIVGFDGIEEGQCLDIPLTTVEAPVALFCEQAMDILIRRMNDQTPAALPQMVVPTRLLKGGTA